MKFSVEKQIQTVFATDKEFWKNHCNEISKWLVEHNWKLHSKKYGFFEYENEEQLMMFLLSWSW
jgi:hypothetical protein